MGKSVDIDTKQIPLCTLIQKYVKPFLIVQKNQRISQQKTVINHLTFFLTTTLYLARVIIKHTQACVIIVAL